MMRLCLLTLTGLLTITSLGQDATPSASDLIAQAQAAYRAKHFDESVRLFMRVLPLVQGSDRAHVEYSLAGAQTLANSKASALDTLDHAIEDGFMDRREAEANQDFVPLQSDPRWQQLLERMTLVARQQDLRWGDEAFASPYAANIADEDKLAGLSELWAQAKFGFANFWHVPRLDWDQTYRETIPKVLATHSTFEYYRILQGFYAQLQDGHTNVYMPEQMKISFMPLKTRLIDGKLLVLGSTRADFDLQGLRAGDEILTIDGEPSIVWARQHIEPFISASTLQDRENRTFGGNLFSAPEGTSYRLTTSTPAGAHGNLSIKVPSYVPSHRVEFEFRMLPGNIAYVALNEFENDADAKEWDMHWPEISRATALILDLRENGGGDDSIGNHILATLVDKPSAGALSQSTRWIATYRAWGLAETPLALSVSSVKPNPARHFSGKTILLTSPRTFSAAEDMTIVFVQAHRGEIVGEATGGSTGQPLFLKLPGGGAARICTKHDSFVDGREFVGVGIQPDVVVHQSRADIISNHDSALGAALRMLQAKP